MSNRDILLDDITHDLKLARFDLQIVNGMNATKQRIKILLKSFLEEWFLDITNGIPYYEEIFRKRPDGREVENLIKVAIKSVPGVLEILSFDLSYDNAERRLTIDFSVSTEDGIINSTNEVGL